MKKYMAFVLSLLIIISLTACADEADTSQNNFVEIYKSKATEYIENGDTEAAIEVLEEGVEKTGSAELQQMLDELNEEPNVEDSGSNSENGNTDSKDSILSEESNATDINSQDNLTDEKVNEQMFNIEDYVGWWKEHNDYTSGGMRLNIYDDGEYVWFVLSYSRENDYQIADTSIMLLKEKLNKNIIESAFSDSFGNYGYVSIELTPNQVICKISNVKEPYYGANWGIFEGEYILPYYEMQH